MTVDRDTLALFSIFPQFANNQALYGTDQAETIAGNAGKDYIEGKGIADQLFGGGGLGDALGYDSSPTHVMVRLADAGVANAGLWWGDAEGDTASGFANVLGSQFDDRIAGDDRANILVGQGGDDGLSGNGGNDTIYGGDGNDWLSGGDGGDLLRGGAGDDHLQGGLGSDTLEGGDGDDRISGGEGFDSITGGAGAD